MGTWNKEERAYLMCMQRALDFLATGARGKELLEKEVNARLGGMRLPANVDKCVLTELARKEIRPELEILSTAMAWTLEKGLKLPPSRIAKYLDIYNEKIDEYRYSPEAMRTDARILDQSWGGADLAGKKYLEMQEARINKEN